MIQIRSQVLLTPGLGANAAIVKVRNNYMRAVLECFNARTNALNEDCYSFSYSVGAPGGNPAGGERSIFSVLRLQIHRLTATPRSPALR